MSTNVLGMETLQNEKPRKIRRIGRACDYCHRRSIRCQPSQDRHRCQNCVDFDQACTYDRPAKKRGAKSGPTKENAIDVVDRLVEISHHRNGQSTEDQRPDRYAQVPPAHPTAKGPSSGPTFLAPVVASQGTVMDLVEVYFEVTYPIFPFLHRPTILRRVSRGEYSADRALFALVMSICALASARARDGALFSERWSGSALNEPQSETFFAAATDQIPQDLSTARSLDFMRACALLAITSIQYGHIRKLHQYLGIYHVLVAMDGLHDEANWPKNLGIVEIEERRRLFWSIYTLDVYSSIVWNGIIRCREDQSNVLYPTEVDDELFSNSGFRVSPIASPSVTGQTPASSSTSTSSHTISWLRGWNFTTDLYRVLEHAVDHFRQARQRRGRPSFVQKIFGDSSVSQSSVLNSVMTMYTALPQRFKETPAITLDLAEDRYSFQAANIAATMQLLRMVLFAAVGATVEQKCQIASELLQGFSTVPMAYLRAISSPLLHHLGGIGSILGSVLEDTLSESSYRQVRSVLLAMADLLADLELRLHNPAGASAKLKNQVHRIDEYMQEQRQRILHSQSREIVPNNSEQQYQYQNNANYASGETYNPMASEFQLPPELLQDWPWELDFAGFTGVG